MRKGLLQCGLESLVVFLLLNGRQVEVSQRIGVSLLELLLHLSDLVCN